MIDVESFQELTPEVQNAVRSAMLTICNSGVLQIQKDRDFLRILAGAADEDPTLLANRVIEHRRNQYALAAFLEATNQIRDTES